MLLGQFRECLKPEPSVPSITVFPFAADNGKPMTRVFLTDIMDVECGKQCREHDGNMTSLLVSCINLRRPLQSHHGSTQI